MSQMALDLIARAKAEGATRLDLGRCGIVGAVPEEIEDLYDLQELILSDQWEDPDTGESLQSGNFGDENRITALPEKFPQKITVLIAAGTDLIDISSIKNIVFLEVLDLSRTGVTDITPLSNLRWLEKLNLADSKVLVIPRSIEPPRVKTLILRNSSIEDISSLRQYSQLVKLDLVNTEIETINGLANLKNLEILLLNNSKVADVGPLARTPNLRVLELENTMVKDVKPLNGLEYLEELYLKNSKVSSIRGFIRAPNLHTLYLNQTKLKSIRSLSKIRSLVTLSLEGTNVENIGSLSSNTWLRELSIGGTKVGDISPLADLDRLRVLSIANTPVTDVSALEKLKNLKILWLSGAQVRDLRPIEKQIANGLHLEARCPLTNPPIEVAQKGNNAILAYWREQDRVGILPAVELKLILVGNTTAGKSTLVHALIHDEFLIRQNSTEGANLTEKWEIGNIKVNLWDFGGQEYFHATYQLMMSDDAIYVIVVDPNFNLGGSHRTEIRYFGEDQPFNEDLEHFPHSYWLNIVENQGSRSGAMVVWNKLDQESRPKYGMSDANKALFEGNIQEYSLSLKAALLNKSPAWINKWQVFKDDLRQKITKMLKDKHVIQYWPSVKLDVEERSKSDIRISWAEFDRLCKVDDPLRELGNIVIYLRDMCGAILFFPDHPQLNQTVFINPNKINELIYAVLNRQVKNAGGRFTSGHAKERVRAALKRMHGAEMDKAEANVLATELIAVMEEFKIIFEVSEGSGEYVAPQYLPREEPKSLEKEIRRAKLEPAFQLRFKSFVPRHIISRFIAEKGLFAKDETWWKFGILYEETIEATALVQVDYPSQIVSVSIHEPKKHQLELHKVFRLLKDLIGKDNAFELSVDGQNFVAYEKLKEAIETKASLVKTLDGMLLGVERFSLFDTTAFTKHHSFPIKHENPTPMKHIYISYANEDRTDLDEIENKLKTLQKLGKFSSWSRRHIIPGGKTREVISNELSRADVVIMLVSSNYISIEGEGAFEHDLALNQGKEGKCLIVPIVLRSTFGWEGLPFGEYPPALEGRPIDLEPNKDQAWARIMEWIDRILKVQAEKNEGSVRNLGPDETHNSLIKIAKDVSAMSVIVGEVRESQIRIEGGIGILLELSKEQRDDIRNVQSFVERNMFTEDQMLDAIQVIEDLVAVHIDDLEADVKEEFAKLKSKDLEIKKRLKMTIPIIPFVLRYELDMTDNSKDKKGRSLWKDMKNGKILF